MIYLLALEFMSKHPLKHHQPPAKQPVALHGLGIDVPELQQARAFWAMNRFDDSLQMFEKAVRKYPQNLLALVDASRALGARFEVTRAEAFHQLLIVGALHERAPRDDREFSLAADLDWPRDAVQACVTLVFDRSFGFDGARVRDAAIRIT